MTPKYIFIRLAAVGGKQVRDDLVAIGRDGSASMRQLESSGRASGTALQNFGFQVQDFAVQVAGGTSATRALAQQLPQLLSGFGLLGVGIGSAVAIGAALLSFMGDTRDRAAEVKKALDEINSSANAYKAVLAAAIAPTDELTRKFGEQADGVRQLREQMLLIEQIQYLRDLKAGKTAFAGVFDGIGGALAEIANVRAQINDLQSNLGLTSDDVQIQILTGTLGAGLRDLREEFGLTEQQATQLYDAVQRLNAADGPAQVAVATRDIALAITGAAKAGADIPDTLLEAAQQASKLSESAASMNEMLSAGAGIMKEMSGIDIGAGISAAAGRAAELVGNLAAARAQVAALGTAQQQFDAKNKTYSGRGEDPRKFMTAGAFSPTPDVVKAADAIIAPRVSTGRGGGGVDKDLTRAKTLFEQTRTSAEKYAAELAEVQRLYREGDIDGDLYARSVKKLDEQFGKLEGTAAEAAQAIRSAFDNLFDDPAKALQDLAKQLAQMALYRGLAQGLPSIFGAGGFLPLVKSANGNVFSGGNVIPFATGGVVTRPTHFPLTRGVGLMGEAGPEAILPLTRIGGRLGVAAAGGGNRTTVNVINNSGQPAREERQQGPNGEEMIQVIVGDGMARGRYDKPLRRYGVTPDRVIR